MADIAELRSPSKAARSAAVAKDESDENPEEVKREEAAKMKFETPYGDDGKVNYKKLALKGKESTELKDSK